jgi:O-methyltransferase domain/Dimerisation domain
MGQKQLSPDYILQLGFGFWASQALLTAVGLGVFSELAKAPADAGKLQQRLKLHPRAARDFFDALVALKLLDRNDGIYSNSAETDLFLDRAKSSYIGGLLGLAHDRIYQLWGSLANSLQTGQRQFVADHDGDIFSAMYDDPEQLEGFLTAMSGISAGPATLIADKFDWAPYKTFADVGTAQGVVPATLARAHPHLKGIGYDLHQVQPVFEKFVAKQGLADRVRFQPGDFFKDPLPQADVIVMGHILHDWDLPQKKMLLQKAFAALPKGGVLIVYDNIIDDDRRENVFGLLMSLNMLIETSGGFDYTGADCRSWMEDVGFTKTEVVHLAGPESMVLGFK